MKNVAICLSGHMRMFHVCAQTLFERVINKNPDYNFNIFISTWDQLCCWPERHTVLEKMYGSNWIDKIKEIYKPVELEVEPNEYSKEFDTSGFEIDHSKVRHGNGAHVLAMYYKVLRANTLKFMNEKLEYDLVIRLRPDCWFYDDLDISTFISNRSVVDRFKTPKDDVIYTPHKENWNGINDQMAIGPSHLMNEYSCCYNDIRSLIESGKVDFHPENILKAHCNNRELKIKPTDFKYNLHKW